MFWQIPLDLCYFFQWIYLSLTLWLCNLEYHSLPFIFLLSPSLKFHTNNFSQINIGFVLSFPWICFGPSSGFVRGDTSDLWWSASGGYLSAVWSGNRPAWWRTIFIPIFIQTLVDFPGKAIIVGNRRRGVKTNFEISIGICCLSQIYSSAKITPRLIPIQYHHPDQYQ